MGKILITTDTTADLPNNFIIDNNIDIITLFYSFGEVVFGSEKTLNNHEFYERMREGEMPKTMACNPEDCKELFSNRVAEGYDVIHIAFSSQLSSSYNNARIAAEEIKEENPSAKIEVIDSLSASLGEGLAVYKAVQLRNEGKSFEQIVEWLNENLLHIVHYFTVDDLNHLYRGGRVSRATAIVGTIAGIKPVLHVSNEGKLVAVGKVRGRKKSLLQLVDSMEAHIGSYRDKNDIVFIGHGDCIEDARFVADKVRERFGIENIVINYICPTIGAHSGPGTVALFFMGDER